MSIDAYRWALKARVGRSSAKMVLISLADRANENHICFPSIKRLEFDTELNRKTVMSSIKHLEEIGLLSVKKEKGKGNYYTLIGVSDRYSELENKDDPFCINRVATLQYDNVTGSPNIGTTNSGTTQVPIQGQGESQFRDTEPKGTQTKPLNNKKAAKVDFDAITCDLPKFINDSAWREWARFRKNDKRKPITLSAAQKQIDLLSQYDFETQQEIIDSSISSDYQGLFAPTNQKQRGVNSARNRTLAEDLNDRSWIN